MRKNTVKCERVTADVVAMVDAYVSNDSILVLNNDGYISQTILEHYLDVDRMLKNLKKKQDELKASLVDALDAGHTAEQGAGKHTVELKENEPRVKWKDLALDLAKELGYAPELYEEAANNVAKTSGKATYSVKVK